MQVLIINLPEAAERMDFQQAQMQRLGLDFRRLEEITTAQLDPPADAPYWKTWQRPLRDTEKAAFLSHKRAWQTVLDENRPFLILEDDAVLSSAVPGFLSSCESIDWADHLSLEVRGRKKIVGKKMASKEIPVRRLYQDRTGAAAYILWPAGAKKLLERCRNYSGLADAVISSTYALKSYQCDPALALQLDMCETYGIMPPLQTRSFIDSGKHDRQLRCCSDPQWYGFKSRRLLSQLRMGVRHLGRLFVSQRTHIPLSGNF
ncbi:MAG: glycosyltransferase family 25 protein [Gammaproteobacteria bacterium]